MRSVIGHLPPSNEPHERRSSELRLGKLSHQSLMGSHQMCEHILQELLSAVLDKWEVSDTWDIGEKTRARCRTTRMKSKSSRQHELMSVSRCDSSNVRSSRAFHTPSLMKCMLKFLFFRLRCVRKYRIAAIVPQQTQCAGSSPWWRVRNSLTKTEVFVFAAEQGDEVYGDTGGEHVKVTPE